MDAVWIDIILYPPMLSMDYGNAQFLIRPTLQHQYTKLSLLPWLDLNPLNADDDNCGATVLIILPQWQYLVMVLS